ncbi:MULTISPECIES: hypothetical protein [Micromonospora]|uniref:Transposase IS701-like DDE domain-containing protein n=1 Tax=Micromonospora tulbaghiae TaxID=479978 RepID=A0A386WJN8_9ACTN|nr:hypothetical protein [Micromonospora tulbaghiae]AYF26904.1 hypothetical protein CSH63_05495 [Micromonospora tulbaghiae]NED58454.1 transposase [Micromonospora aurantiaca]
MQQLLYRAVWDADAGREDLRQMITSRFGDPDAILVVDDIGDLKKGVTRSSAAAVHRHGGADGEHQVGVLLATPAPMCTA